MNYPSTQIGWVLPLLLSPAILLLVLAYACQWGDRPLPLVIRTWHPRDTPGFTELGDYGNYLMVQKEKVEIHFFEFKGMDPKENYGRVYIRTDAIDELYRVLLDKNVAIHPNAPLQQKSWGQWEFSLLDPDNNLLTFGQHLFKSTAL